jgi:hypoxanthine phosphoribosyltransferase
MPNYRISILGKLELRNADGSLFANVPTGRLCRLLIELVTADLRPRGPQVELGCASFPNLKRALWNAAIARDDRHLQVPVSQLRKRLPEDIGIEKYESTYRLVGIARSDIDILDFVDQSLTTDPAKARELLELWRGDPSQIYPSSSDDLQKGFIPSGIWKPVLEARKRLGESVDNLSEATPSKPPDGMTPAVSVADEPWFDEHRVGDTRLTWDHVELAVQRVLEKLAEWTPDMIIGINRGGAIFGGMLAKLIPLRYIGVIAYVVSPTAAAFRQVQAPDLSAVPEGGQILIVDEAHRSGHHMHHAVCDVRRLRPDVEVKTAVIAKADARPEDGIPDPDQCAFRVSGNACMPWDPGVAGAA